ncbi:MAG: 3'(2'),5'-bisphosphate nucleotidase CysQ [Bacteroidales bacterium]|nr:3'(2'),5'-bisphosphate nucleotidase CysQ [Bacteroidales bacterium]MBN2748647.1 3'(2'),5'-bisphosphate nucleotidase CysQ [Bacteroidales bacterium]
MINDTELWHLLSAAISTAVRAGGLIMDVYNSDDFHVNLKSDSTPLTLADRKAHSEISNSLMKTRIPVLSEEGRNLQYEERKGWEYFWLVDPLDGTKEFIKRNGEFTVNIALVYNGYPIMGVVYVPVSGSLYFSVKGKGAFLIEQILPEVSADYIAQDLLHSASKLPIATERDSFIVVGSRSHMSKETEEYIALLRGKFHKVDFKPRGSSLKICMVAEGNADVYPRFAPTTEWDTAAGQAVAEEAGCSVVSVDGNERLVYNKENLENPWFIVQRRANL